MEDFVTWLTGELDKRGWSNSELARRAGVTHTTISMIISKHNNPGPDLCQGIARAFKLPPEIVFRKAGLLPQLPEETDSQLVTKCQDYYKRLPSKVKEEVLEYIIYRYEHEQEQP